MIKSLIKYFLVAVLLAPIYNLIQPYTCHAKEVTNAIPANVFLTDDGSLLWFNKKGDVIVDNKKIEDASRSKESLPSDQDSKGNWGNKTNGLQMSARFEKSTFMNSEPMIVSVLVRNISNKSVTYSKIYTGDWPLPVQIEVKKNGIPVERKQHSTSIDVISVREGTIYPQTQNKFQIDLEKYYYLKEPGEYTIQASCAAENHLIPNEKVMSGIASIKLEASASTNNVIRPK